MLFEPSRDVKLRFSKERVLEFECELSERLKALSRVESEIIEVGKLRHSWLNCVSQIDSRDTDLFKKRVDVIRRSSELIFVNLALDLVRLEGLQERLSLDYLVEATKSLAVNETIEMRDQFLDTLLRQNSETWREALISSLAVRQNLSLRSERLGAECDQIRIDFEEHGKHLISELHRRMSTYVKHLNDATKESQSLHKKITGDYLVIRHNSKVAQDILLKKQMEANLHRAELRERLELLLKDAQEQRSHMADASAAELRVITDGSRSEVLQREALSEDIQKSIDFYKIEQKNRRAEMRRTVKTFNRKYLDLQRHRQAEIRTIEGELRLLREQVADLEMQLHSRHSQVQ